VWDPAIYLEFADERARPFGDLMVQVLADSPEHVVDLGCGPGQLTAALLDRWPHASVLGLDSSPAMIDRALEHERRGVRFRCEDLRNWVPDGPVDVVISNATLQWVPGHRELLARFVSGLSEDGWLAFQVPGNFAEPSHRLLHELAADPRFSRHTAGVQRPAAADAADYLADLSALGCAVDAWETTYLHVLTGPDPVLAWIAGTGARPVLQALPDDLRSSFEREYRAALAEAYPPRPYGTLLPFRRVFVVARRPTS